MPKGIVDNVASYCDLTQDELRTSNSLLGYKAMWKLLRDKYHITVNRQAKFTLFIKLYWYVTIEIWLWK